MWFGDIDIPAELVQAAQAGQLVLFIGAGASMSAPASLPSFASLVDSIVTRTRTTIDPRDAGQFDRILGKIHDTGVKVHNLVAEAIGLPGSAPNRLHKAVIAVANSNPPLRIVTTNYDLHLTAAAGDAGLAPEVFRGPALPTGDDFQGIVHLHGALDREPRSLIVTDRDFGRAYLRDAWATRFAERMFARYTVAFIGYSHGDVVLSYLARALVSAGGRYIFTHEPEKSEWKSLGIIPIAYPLTAGTHDALPDGLERWAKLSSMGYLDHHRRITELVSERPPSIPEDISYLEDCFESPQYLRYFTDGAHGHEWLWWAAERPQFSHIFAPDHGGGSNLTIADTIARWVIDDYILNPDESATALILMRDRAWSDRTLSMITQGLFAHGGGISEWLAPWLLLVLQRTPTGPSDLLDMILIHESWCDRVGPSLLLLFEHRTRPRLVSRPSFTDKNEVLFDVDLAGGQDWLRQAWTQILKPALSQNASALLDLTVSQIQSAYRIYKAATPGRSWDVFSFRRAAIEDHQRDHLGDSLDVLIDAARDCIEHLLTSDVHMVSHRLDEWFKAPESILRRLAIHGLRVRTDLDPEEKIQRISETTVLYDLETQHEVFKLLADVTPQVGEGVVSLLLEHVMQGPPDSGLDDRSTAYRRYNLLVWLNRHVSGSNPIADAFDSVQRDHPDFGPREQPDLHVTTTSGFVEDAEPFTAEELHSRFADDPAGTLEAIREFREEEDAFHWTGPTWRGALQTTRSWIRLYPFDGLGASRHLKDDEGQLRAAFIDGWSESELSLPQVKEVVSVLASWDADQVRHPIARMLASGGVGTKVTAWHRYPEARSLAMSLWPDSFSDGALSASVNDPYLEALNHPAGNLAQFWLHAIAHDWKRDVDSWKGIPADLRVQLDRMVNATDRNGLLARVILAEDLRFLHAADAPWAESRLLPLFDWSANSEEADALWNAFLSYGQFDDRLLAAGLLQGYLKTCAHTQRLGKQATSRLAFHLASVALQSSIDPNSWILDFVAMAPPELRAEWASNVGRLLRDFSADESNMQWDRWIREYWTGRAASVPIPFTPGESAEMAKWVMGLRQQLPQVVRLARESSATPANLRQLLRVVAEEDFTDDATHWAEFLTDCLARVDHSSFAIDHYLPGIVESLRLAAPDLDLKPLINEALRLGCRSAGSW